MNKVERVWGGLRSQAVDRVPVGLWYHFPPGEAHGRAAVRAHLDYYRASGLDFIKVMNEHPFRAGAEINSPGDWRKVRPVPLSSPFFQQQLDVIRGIVDGVAGDCLVISTVFGPYAAGGHTSGERITEHLRADPEAVSAGLAAIAESLAEFCLACVQSGLPASTSPLRAANATGSLPTKGPTARRPPTSPSTTSALPWKPPRSRPRGHCHPVRRRPACSLLS